MLQIKSCLLFRYFRSILAPFSCDLDLATRPQTPPMTHDDFEIIEPELANAEARGLAREAEEKDEKLFACIREDSVIPPPIICEHFARPSAAIIKPMAVRPVAPFPSFAAMDQIPFRPVIPVCIEYADTSSCHSELSSNVQEADSGLESDDSMSCDIELNASDSIESVFNESESLDSLDEDQAYECSPEYSMDDSSKKASNTMSTVRAIEHYDPVDQLDLVRCFKPAPKPMSRLERVKKSLKRVTHKARKLSLDLAYFQFTALTVMIGL